MGAWISAGAPNDSPKAPFDFASLKQPPVPKFLFKPGNKPGESSPILFVASYPADNGRRPSDGEVPDPPAIPGNFWDTSPIALTNEAVAPGLITVGLTKDPHQMQVHTYDPAGKPAKRPFHVAVFRD